MFGNFDCIDQSLTPLLSLTSLQHITALYLDRIPIIGIGILPASLKSLYWNPKHVRDSDTSLFALLLQSPCRLESLELTTFGADSPYQPEYYTIYEFFRFKGIHTKHLVVDFYNSRILSELIEFTPQLLTVKLTLVPSYSIRYNISSVIAVFTCLPVQTRLQKIEIGEYDIEICSKKDFLLPLLNLPQLSNLKEIYHSVKFNSNIFPHPQPEDVRRLTDKSESLQSGLNHSIELCKSKGVNLFFSEEKEHIRIRVGLECGQFEASRLMWLRMFKAEVI